jgi:hypothetical protein
MLEVLTEKNAFETYNSSKIIKGIKSDAERGDFFSAYSSLEQNISLFGGNEEIKGIGREGIDNSLKFAMINAERGIIYGMNMYLELAFNYSSLFGMDISKDAEEITDIGKKNKIACNYDKTIHKRCGIIRIAGYADL